MKEFGKISEKIISELKNIVGERCVWTTNEKRLSCSRDQTSALKENEYYIPEVVVAPADAEQISKVLKLANKYIIPVTPRGGGTGLSGGSLPVYGGIVITDERMNKIIEIDSKNLVAVVQPGVITGDINTAAAKVGLWYAGYPMSVDICHIGGNIAENSGGGMAVKYGVTMRYVLGLEFVTPTGEILELGGKLMKNVTGYNLKEFFIGSEGTLGIATKITLRLQPLPKNKVDLLVMFHTTEEAIAAVPKIVTEGGILPSAIEYMDKYTYKASCDFLNEELPINDVGAVLLIELDGTREQSVELDADRTGNICSECGAMEIYVADNATTRERVWSVRLHIDEALRVTDPTHTDEDTVVPVSEIPKFAEGIENIAKKHGVKITNFGHAGDGNLHPTISRKEGLSDKEWDDLERKIEWDIFNLTYSLGGVISGEHGIGWKRTEFFAGLCPAPELSIMKSIKKLLDPNGIMNPGKVFSDK